MKVVNLAFKFDSSEVNKIGQVFRYLLIMHELKRKKGDTINIHIGDVIPSTTIQEIADLKEITK